MNKLFQNTQRSCNNGDKFLVLQLQNPVDKTDILDLRINLKDTTIANAWFDQCVKCLDQKLHVEKNFCWLGWPDPNRNVDFLKQKLSECVNRINTFSNNNPIWGGYRIETNWTDISSNDALNQLHHHFEILMGQVWDVSNYIKTADDTTKYQIRQLNNLVHELQSRRNVEGIAFSNIQPMTIVSYLNIERELFQDEYYDHFDLNKNFGDIFLHYSQTGKTPIEAYTDRDDHVFDNNINALRYLSGEYNVWWGDSMSSTTLTETKNNLKSWLNDKGVIKSEEQNFSYYVDQEDNKQGIGWITVAQIVNPYANKEELLKAISTKLNIVKLTAYINNSEIASHSWDYSWADSSYEDLEISILKDHFPR